MECDAFIAGRRLVFAAHSGLVVLTALLGGVVGVVAAGLWEYRTLQRLGVLPLAGVGLIEETAKLIVPLIIVLVLRRDRHPADGLLLGVASGAGFAVPAMTAWIWGIVVLNKAASSHFSLQAWRRATSQSTWDLAAGSLRAASASPSPACPAT